MNSAPCFRQCFRQRSRQTACKSVTHVFCVLIAMALVQMVGTISLAQAQNTATDGKSAQQDAAATISGLVSEAVSGEAVIGVTVALYREAETKPFRGARTNKFGFYSIPSVPSGLYRLVVKGIGYKETSEILTVGAANIRKNIKIATSDVQAQEVAVEASRDVSPTRSISTIAVKTEFINQMPSIGGEKDVFRALQLLPGVKAASEVSSGLYVRGGSPDQNLTLLDGVIVYNPSHLFGLFSTFNGDALADNGVKLIKGAFPAEYGGRLASVIDLTMREGTKEKLSGTGSISTLSSRLTLEGPLFSEDVTFMISGRRTYFDILFGLFTESLPPAQRPPTYYFYDLNAKVNWKASENDRVFVSGYFGRDVLTPAPGTNLNFNFDWGNATANARWMHIVSPNLFTNFSVIYTDYQFRFGFGADSTISDVAFASLSRIRDVMVRGNAEWIVSPEHTVKFGVEAIQHNFTTLAESSNRDLQQFFDQFGGNNAVNALEAAAFVQDEWQITPQLFANVGLRLSYFDRGQRLLPEPRLSLSYQVSDEIKLNGAVAVANQFLHLVVRNDIPLPTDAWFPSTEKILPANAVQYVLGAETQILDGLTLNIEGYYKSMQNLYEFRDDATFNLFAPAENQLTAGTGEAYGVEFFLQKQLGAFTGWVGYTLSWTTRTFAELNGGKPFFPRYDRRHDVSFVGSYKLSDAWEFGIVWTYGTGQAFTMPSGQYDFSAFPTGSLITNPSTAGFNRPRLQYSQRNSFTLPAYHRLDLSVRYTWTESWLNVPMTLSLDVYNVYNRQNPFAWFVNYRAEDVPPDPNVPRSQQQAVIIPQTTQLSLIPILPSLSWSFRF